MRLFEFPRDKAEIDRVVSCAEYAALLIPSPRQSYVEEVCAQARQFGFAGVVATPFDCPTVLKLLEGSGVETICLNALNHALDENFDCRMFGIQALLEQGVKHFELGVPCGLLREGAFDVVHAELAAMVEKIHAAGGKMSVILEPECMSKDAMAKVIAMAEELGADHVRLCSGFERVCGTNGGRATLNTICFAREQHTGKIGLKAGGGWDYAYLEDCAEYMENGASRVDVGPRFVEQLANLGYRRDA